MISFLMIICIGNSWDKRQLYESDIRIPFVVMGPGIPRNATTSKVAVSIDIAPTLIELATGNSHAVPEEMDGHSLASWMRTDTASDIDSQHSEQFLVEYYGRSGHEMCHSRWSEVVGDNGWSNWCDGVNNTYHCIRGISNQQRNGSIYCKFKCFKPGANDSYREEVECDDDGSAQLYGEHYDLESDPFQLINSMLTLSAAERAYYDRMLRQFMDCKGRRECDPLRSLEFVNSDSSGVSVFRASSSGPWRLMLLEKI